MIVKDILTSIITMGVVVKKMVDAKIGDEIKLDIEDGEDQVWRRIK